MNLRESPVTGRFARLAATFSLLAPLIILLVVFLVRLLHLRNVLRIHLAWIVIEALVAITGLVFGVIALLGTKRHGTKGLLGKAMVGVCLNCLLLRLLLVAIFVYGFWLPRHSPPRTLQARLDKATQKLASASTDEERFYSLDDAAKDSFNQGKIEDARKYATELLMLVPDFQDNWNYGNAVQDGNLVLGRIAVREGRIEEAKTYLLEAGKSPGSPQMDSFGPNVSLAKDLLEKGERDTVLQYFELCRKFWTMDFGKLDEWSKEVKAGEIPDFGANLVY